MVASISPISKYGSAGKVGLSALHEGTAYLYLPAVLQAGEFWWRIAMEALPGGPEHLPLLTAPLGRVATHTFTVGNPTSSEAHFSCSSSDAARFSVPSGFSVAAHGTAEVQLEYRPGSLGVEETARLAVTSDTVGSVEYVCRGLVSVRLHAWRLCS